MPFMKHNPGKTKSGKMEKCKIISVEMCDMFSKKHLNTNICKHIVMKNNGWRTEDIQSKYIKSKLIYYIQRWFYHHPRCVSFGFWLLLHAVVSQIIFMILPKWGERCGIEDDD